MDCFEKYIELVQSNRKTNSIDEQVYIYYFRKQYHRILDLFMDPFSVSNESVLVKYWFIQSLIKCKRFKECDSLIKKIQESIEPYRYEYLMGISCLKQHNYHESTKHLINSFCSNPYFLEPFMKLFSHHLINESEFSSLMNKVQCDESHKRVLYDHAALKWLYSKDSKSSFAFIRNLMESGCLSDEVVAASISLCVSMSKQQDLFIIAQRLLDQSPDSYIAPYAAGCFQYLIGRTDSARSFLWLSLQRSPNFAAAWIAYALAFRKDNDPRMAINILVISARAFPKLDLIHLWIAHYQSQIGESSLALAYYLKCEKNGYVMNEIGCLLLSMGKLKQAEIALDRALTYPEVHPSYYINCASLKRRLSKFQEAENLYKKALSIDSNNTYAILGLAFTLHLEGSVLEAIEYYNKALHINPSDNFAQEMREEAMKEMVKIPIEQYIKDDPSFDNRYQTWSKS